MLLMTVVSARVRTVFSRYCLILYIQLSDRLKRKRKGPQIQPTLFWLYALRPPLRYAAYLRGYTCPAVSCGTETAWVMSGVINNGTAHNHPPPLHPPSNQYLSSSPSNSLRESRGEFRISLAGHLAATQTGSVTSEIIAIFFSEGVKAQERLLISALSIALILTNLFFPGR